MENIFCFPMVPNIFSCPPHHEFRVFKIKFGRLGVLASFYVNFTYAMVIWEKGI